MHNQKFMLLTHPTNGGRPESKSRIGYIQGEKRVDSAITRSYLTGIDDGNGITIPSLYNRLGYKSTRLIGAGPRARGAFGVRLVCI